jgi:hypothetical protein
MEEHSDLIDMSNDLSLSGRRERSVRGGGRGRGGRGGTGGGGSIEKREVQVSKALSKLLRHDAEKEGLVLDAEGFARVDQVVGLLFTPFILGQLRNFQYLCLLVVSKFNILTTEKISWSD